MLISNVLRKIVYIVAGACVFLPIVLGPSSCVEERPLNIAFDESHTPLFTVADPNGYKPLADLLAGAGYQVSTFTTNEERNAELAPGNPNPTISIVVIALPTVGYGNIFHNATIRNWVGRGGILILITDHDPHPLRIEALAGEFGATIRNTAIVHEDLTQHCPPGLESCPQGVFSFVREDSPSESLMVDTLFNVAPYFTIFTGSSFYVSSGVDVRPLLTYTSPTNDFYTGEEVGVGEYAGAVIKHGQGRVYISTEAGSWSCRKNPIPTGWCPIDLGNGETFSYGPHNDEFILTLLYFLRVGGFFSS